MKKSMIALTVGLAIGLGLVNESKAEERSWEWSPLGIGIAAPLQLPFISSDVYGLRLGGFLGYNNDFRGLDIGLAEVSSVDMMGLQCAAFTWTAERVYGVQLSALANVVHGRMAGLELGTVNTLWTESCGVQFGAVNYDAAFAGVQVGGIVNWNNSASAGLEISPVNANQDEYVGCALGAVNYAQKFQGLSLGLVNVSYEVTGCQFGVFNACDRMKGVQFGLINMICESKLPIMVIANASF